MGCKRCTYTLLIALSLCIEYASAQDQKIGFIDSEAIMQQMPEYSGIEQRLDLLSESWQQDIDEMENEIEELEREFEAREILFTDEIRAERLNEIEQRRSELEQYIDQRFGPDGDYYSRQKELLEPIQRLVFNALSRVADRESYDFVFDRSDDIRFLITREEWNLTDEVMLELGLNETGN